MQSQIIHFDTRVKGLKFDDIVLGKIGAVIERGAVKIEELQIKEVEKSYYLAPIWHPVRNYSTYGN